MGGSAAGATSRLLRYPNLFPEEPPLKIVWEEEQRDVVEAAWRDGSICLEGTKFGKVSVALLRAAAIPWRIFNGGRRGQRGSRTASSASGRSRASLAVAPKIAGELVYVGMCDEKQDAARLVDIILVVVGEEAPET